MIFLEGSHSNETAEVNLSIILAIYERDMPDEGIHPKEKERKKS